MQIIFLGFLELGTQLENPFGKSVRAFVHLPQLINLQLQDTT
jgi:hypothetical protein